MINHSVIRRGIEKQQKHNERIVTCWLTLDQKAELERRASRRGMSVSEWVGRAILLAFDVDAVADTPTITLVKENKHGCYEQPKVQSPRVQGNLRHRTATRDPQVPDARDKGGSREDVLAFPLYPNCPNCGKPTAKPGPFGECPACR